MKLGGKVFFGVGLIEDGLVFGGAAYNGLMKEWNKSKKSNEKSKKRYR
ncbi:hypothetical protein [Bacillus manliponensis]